MSVAHFWVFFLIYVQSSAEQNTSSNQIVSWLDHGLRQAPSAHPRILASETDFSTIRATLEKGQDAAAAQLFDAMTRAANTTLNITIPGTCSRKKGGNTDTIRLFSQLYKITGNSTFSERLLAEMDLACTCANWGGPTYLLTAQYTIAVSLGLDWAWDAISSSNRTRYQDCIIRLGISQNGYMHYAENFKGQSNRNIVAHAGYIVGALATWERNTTLSMWLLNQSLASMPAATQMYGVDGAWWEGFVYWGYATWHSILTRNSLLLSFGSTMGFLDNAAGFNTTADFPMYTYSSASVPNVPGSGWNGPGASFNWADANVSNFQYCAVPMWLHHVFPNPAYAYLARELQDQYYKCGNGCQDDALVAADMLLFWSTEGSCADVRGHARHRRFSSAFQPDPAVVGVLKSAWWCTLDEAVMNGTDTADKIDDNSSVVFLGMKYGTASWSHGHADVGSFVFDANGVRWAEDLGLSNYETKNATYRDSTAGHNTLLFNDENQIRSASFCSDPERWKAIPYCRLGASHLAFNVSTLTPPFSVVDLSTVNNLTWVNTWTRGFAMLPSETGVVVVDEVNLTSASTNVTWAMHTHATATVIRSSVTLLDAYKNTSISLHVLDPPVGLYDLDVVTLNVPNDKDAPDPGLKRVSISFKKDPLPLSGAVDGTPRIFRIVVQLAGDDVADASSILPLSQWRDQGPFRSGVHL